MFFRHNLNILLIYKLFELITKTHVLHNFSLVGYVNLITALQSVLRFQAVQKYLQGVRIKYI